MMNKKVALLAVGLVLAVLAVRVWLARSAKEIREIKEAFVKVGRLPGLPAPVKALAREVPPEDARAFLNAMAERFQCFWFDGASRFVQIHRMGYRYSLSRDSYEQASDALLLTFVSSSGDSAAMWYGPAGCRIEGVEFLPDSLRVRLRLGVTDTSDGSPLTFVLPWLPDTEPRPGTFEQEQQDD